MAQGCPTQTISTIKWIWTSRLSITLSLFDGAGDRDFLGERCETETSRENEREGDLSLGGKADLLVARLRGAPLGKPAIAGTNGWKTLQGYLAHKKTPTPLESP